MKLSTYTIIIVTLLIITPSTAYGSAKTSTAVALASSSSSSLYTTHAPTSTSSVSAPVSTSPTPTTIAILASSSSTTSTTSDGSSSSSSSTTTPNEWIKCYIAEHSSFAIIPVTNVWECLSTIQQALQNTTIPSSSATPWFNDTFVADIYPYFKKTDEALSAQLSFQLPSSSLRISTNRAPYYDGINYIVYVKTTDHSKQATGHLIAKILELVQPTLATFLSYITTVTILDNNGKQHPLGNICFYFTNEQYAQDIKKKLQYLESEFASLEITFSSYRSQGTL